MVFWQTVDVLKHMKKLKELLAGGKPDQRRTRGGGDKQIPAAPSLMWSWAEMLNMTQHFTFMSST